MVQRYGPEVIGGAENLCRQTAHALRERGYAVTVHTSTARDYLRWEPAYPAGVDDDDGVVVHRSPARPADPEVAAALARRLSLGTLTWDEERRFALAQGPVCPELLARVQATPAAEPVVLWTYLYATTQLVSPLVAGRSIVVPTAHNEPTLRLGLTRGVMNLAGGFAFLTPEERDLVDDWFGLGERPHAVVGAALPAPLPAASRPAPPAPYVLYVGRMDPGKGVFGLLEHHRHYRRRGGACDLVFAGPGATPPELPSWARHVGAVSAAERTALLDGATALAMPSVNESYSLVLAEAWQAGIPTLATGHGEVVAGQTARSGGGLLYLDADSYASQLRRLAADRQLAASLARAGRAWAVEQTWDAVSARWRSLLDAVAARR